MDPNTKERKKILGTANVRRGAVKNASMPPKSVVFRRSEKPKMLNFSGNAMFQILVWPKSATFEADAMQKT